MASVERTAYPRFRRFMSARELHVFYTPAAEEIAWARENASSDEHLLGLVIQLKTFSRLGYFPALDEVPAEVAGHIRRGLRLPEATRPVYASTRTAERHRNLIRARSGVVYDPAGARKVAAEAIEEGARRKNDPADLINIALERLVEGSYELPAFRTLNDMAATIRARVNEEIFAVVAGLLGEAGVARLQRLLVTGAGGKSEFYQLSRPARRPSWSKFREQLERQRRIEGLGDARAWWQGVAPSKIAVARHFRKDRAAMLAMAGTLGLEATSADASVLDLLGHVRTRAGLTRDYIPDHVVLCDEDGTVLLDEDGRPRVKVFGTSFASGHWNAAIRDRKHPGMFVRRTWRPACSPTWPNSCAPATSPSTGPTPMPTGPPS